MAVRREAFIKVGGFRLDFCKVGDKPKPEDTDLCIRMSRAFSGGTWLLVPGAVVDHEVGDERCRFTFFLARCFAEGQTKVELARLNSGGEELTDEYIYVRRALGSGLLRHLARGIRLRDVASFERAFAIATGLGAAGLGAALSYARPVRTREHEDRALL
jgi:GT2 family glycosyltransferase